MAVAQTVLPRLENGDRMDRAEFHRRYSLRPDLHRVELIEGVVYLPSPIRVDQHGEPQATLLAWLGVYRTRHAGLRSSGPATMILDDENEPEPDAMLFRVATDLVNAEGYVAGAPELVAEIAASSVSRDLHQKFQAYERNGIREYIVWRVDDNAIDWFVLRDGRYERLEPGADGVIESEQFPGLRLDVAKALANDLAGVLAAVR